MIGAYGVPAAPAPVIDGGGGFAAVELTNVSHVVVEGLDITNPGGDPSERHRGVSLTAAGQVVQDVTIRDVVIHDIDGLTQMSEFAKRRGVIAEASSGGRFADLRVEDNQIHDVSRSGVFIAVGSGTRPSADGAPWPGGGTGFVARGNVVERVQGDGIVMRDSVGALLEHNVVGHGDLAGFNYRVGDDRRCAAGIWTLRATRTVIQHNESATCASAATTAPTTSSSTCPCRPLPPARSSPTRGSSTRHHRVSGHGRSTGSASAGTHPAIHAGIPGSRRRRTNPGMRLLRKGDQQPAEHRVRLVQTTPPVLEPPVPLMVGHRRTGERAGWPP